MLTSSRRGISYPNPDRSDRPDIPAHILNLVTALELDLIYAQGTHAARLARAHLAGVLFYETDTGSFFYDDGAAWHGFGTSVLAQVAFTSPVTASASTEDTANTVVTAPSVTFDGSVAARLDFFAPSVKQSGGSGDQEIAFYLYDNVDGGGAASIGILADMASHPVGIPVFLSRRIVPAAGDHVFSVRVADLTGGNHSTVECGAGGHGNLMPGYLLIDRV